MVLLVLLTLEELQAAKRLALKLMQISGRIAKIDSIENGQILYGVIRCH